VKIRVVAELEFVELVVFRRKGHGRRRDAHAGKVELDLALLNKYVVGEDEVAIAGTVRREADREVVEARLVVRMRSPQREKDAIVAVSIGKRHVGHLRVIAGGRIELQYLADWRELIDFAAVRKREHRSVRAHPRRGGGGQSAPD